MTMQEQLRALVERHHANILEQIAELGRLLRAGGAPCEAGRSLERAQSLSYQISGTAASMGFTELSAAAGQLDDGLKALMRETGTAAKRKETLALLEEVRRVANATTPEMSALYQGDLFRPRR